MPTRGDLMDTRGWASRKPLDPPPLPEPTPTHAVVFLDLAGKRYAAARPAQIDCLPAVWTRMEPADGEIIRRTWVREYGDAGIVYREQPPAVFVPTAYKPGGGVKNGKRPKGEPEPVEQDEWA